MNHSTWLRTTPPNPAASESETMSSRGDWMYFVIESPGHACSLLQPPPSTIAGAILLHKPSDSIAAAHGLTSRTPEYLSTGKSRGIRPRREHPRRRRGNQHHPWAQVL